ncbi:MAG TPA: ribosome biogenesis GTPase Der [Methylocella sp.]|nr:ribosome biogenesis GTPase Der [Methylocella sp.]
MFTVAIIGRPNTGKSTLFNRLVGKKLALVNDQPGVTRDRREAEARLGDLAFKVIDTAGLEEGDRTSLPGRMRAQTEAAIDLADAIFFVFDSRAGLTSADRAFANLARRAGKPLIVIANKAESRAGAAGAVEGYDLGLGEPIAISAEHGDGFSDIYSALREVFPLEQEEAARCEESNKEIGPEVDLAKPLRVAIIGRPNAGKSTLLNRLLGEDRVLTGPEPGLTRDTISADVLWAGRAIKVYDTAGLRKRAKVTSDLEKLAVADALRAVKFAEAVILLLDATVPFEKQDLTLADLVEREGRALVIGLNKWDLIGSESAKLAEMRAEAARLLPQLKGAPVIPISAETSRGIDQLMEATFHAYEIWNKRISTAYLNRWLRDTIEQTPPPAVAGRRIKIKYIMQQRARPPYFILFGNQLASLPASYERFLINGLRQAFDLQGVPIRISKRTGDNPFTRRRER